MAPVISENEACEGTSSIAAGVRDFDLNDGKATAFHRLLDLPREARDCIYRHALTYHLEEPAMYCPAPAFERPNVALLRCNKQINEEGSEVFAKCNRFVRVETPITYLVSGTKPKPVVWISGENDEKVNNYRNFMMTLELIGQLTSITRVLVIPASQLSNLCNAINHGLQSHPKVPDWHNDLIQIHLHEPFGADYAAKAHAPMIKTLTTHLKERSNHLEMYDEDDLDPCDAAGRAVSDQLRPRRFRTLDAAFQALRDQKDAGTVAFNAKKFLQAAGTWTYAQHNIRFSTAEPWLHDKLAADDEKYAALTMELNYLIGINAAAAWLELAKADAKQRKYFAGMVEFVLSRTVLGPEPETWKPTQAQELKFLFRSGQAARMLGRYKKAFELVQGCAKRGPSDPIIQAEWKLLLREKGLGQLAGVDAGRVVVGLGDDSDSDWVILREDCAGLDFRRCQGGQYEACGCEPLREFHQLQLLALLLE